LGDREDVAAGACSRFQTMTVRFISMTSSALVVTSRIDRDDA
jgi:hypothetical protein